MGITSAIKNLFSKKSEPENEIRIRLEELEFNALIRGGQVHIKRRGGADVKFILADIGFHRMDHCLNGAMVGVKSFQEESIEVNERG